MSLLRAILNQDRLALERALFGEECGPEPNSEHLLLVCVNARWVGGVYLLCEDGRALDYELQCLQVLAIVAERRDLAIAEILLAVWDWTRCSPETYAAFVVAAARGGCVKMTTLALDIPVVRPGQLDVWVFWPNIPAETAALLKADARFQSMWR